MLQQNSTDNNALQAYYDSIRQRVNLRWVKPEGWTWAFQTHDCHKTTDRFSGQTLKMTFQGKYVRAHVTTRSRQPVARHGRGKIIDFSGQSRGRLFDLFNKLEIKNKVIFITLTYIKADIDAKTAKENLFAFIKRLQRRFPHADMSFVWRMEFQERGAIHFHIIAFDLPFVPYAEVQRIWGEITCQHIPFTRIEMVFSSKKVMNYVSKYVAKVNSSSEIGGFNLPTYLTAYQSMNGEQIGRSWGVWGRQHLPMAELIALELPFYYAKFMKFRSMAANQFPPIRNSISFGFRLYVPSAMAWLGWFHGIYDIPF